MFGKTVGKDRLAVIDRSGQIEMVSLASTAIQQSFYSGSKQPKWRNPDERASVEIQR